MPADTKDYTNGNGHMYRNPTHLAEADNAEDQADIVKAIKNTGPGVKQMVVTYDYGDIDKQSPPPLSGILQIRDMSPERAQVFCKNLMRSKPNIFRVHITLGDYPNQKRINSQKVRLLSSNRARFHTEIGEKIGDVLADKNLLVTEIKYNVENVEAGRFSAIAEVYGLDNPDEYFDDKSFSPKIKFEFIKTA